MDSISGGATPCPNCGSRKVRWRNRRLYDIPLTWMRFFADSILSALFVRRAGPASTSHYVSEWQLRGQAEALRYHRRRAAYESKVGLAVGKRFWRCPDCKEKGQVFSGLDEALTRDRAMLASMEDRIVGDMGAVGKRVDRDGLPGK